MEERLDKKEKKEKSPSAEEYLRMNEKEKDAEIEKAVIRLQNRIQKILYLMEAEMKQFSEPKQEGKKEEQKEENREEKQD